MTRPVVSAWTEALYARAAEVYRLGDAAVPDGDDGFPLLRYLSLIADPAGEAVALADRIDYTPPRDGGEAGDGSDLLDAAAADPGWLPWLAQLVGIVIPPGTADDDARALVAAAASWWHHGSAAAIAASVASRLTGTRTVEVTSPAPWIIGVATLEAETDTSRGASWDELHRVAPTWADLEALGSWDNRRLPAIIGAALDETPAGYHVQHRYLPA